MKTFNSALGVCILIFSVNAARAEVAVIVNLGASVTPSQSDVANIFLGKDKSLKGIDQKDWPPAKEKFYGAIVNKNESQLKSYWSGLVFTGKGQPLPSVADDAAVVAKISTELDAIGYIDRASATEKVKILFILP